MFTPLALRGPRFEPSPTYSSAIDKLSPPKLARFSTGQPPFNCCPVWRRSGRFTLCWPRASSDTATQRGNPTPGGPKRSQRERVRCQALSSGSPHDVLGTTLASKSPRPCGLCGETRKMTKTHVPPQTAGNTGTVERAADLVTQEGVRRPGRWNRGGLWVRGLCNACNQLAGRRYDQAYGDFARALTSANSAQARGLSVPTSHAPPVRLAPGLVSRCILIGMFAMHPRLRHIFPALADDLRTEEPALRWPQGVKLRVGQHHNGRALLASGVFMARVLGHRTQHFTFTDVVFPPLIWSLVPDVNQPQPIDQLADASEWPYYGPDRTRVDLRNIVPRLPPFLHPAFSSTRDEWIELMGESDTDAEAVLLHGRLP